MGATRQLAEFVASTTFGQLPPEVVHESKRCILDHLGVALGASQHQAVQILIQSAEEMGGHPQATILGSTIRTSVLQAAMINGTMSHVLDFDDSHSDIVIHPTGPVAAAALPLAEWKHRSGKELLASHALGAEVELRISAAVYPIHYDTGWHITATAGTFGAAVAAGWLLRLDADRLSWALGLAGTQASGLREMFGTMAKPFHVGKAAQAGLLSALLAEKGFTASQEVLEAKRGFCSVLAGQYDLSRAIDGLGTRYLLLRNGFKPYACGVVNHPTIDGVRRLRQRHGLRAEEVVEIESHVHPLVPELTGKRQPRTGLEGKFSTYFAAAIALIEGNARQSQFTDEKVNRPDVVALMDRVRLVVDRSLHENQAVVTIRTADGRELVERVEAATGSGANPMSDEELADKFMDLATGALPRDRAERLAELVWRMDELEDMSALVSLARIDG